MRRCALIVGLMGFAAWGAPAGANADGITVLFHVRPPYAYYDEAHNVTGILVARVKDAVARAGLTAIWVEMPPARQTEEIKRTQDPTCGLGWFKRPEREAFARFSDPIYRDQPTVVVARRDDERFADGMSLEDSFHDRSRALLVKTGYSYGATIDGWINALAPLREASAAPNEELLGMIALARADYAMMAPEEADDLFAIDGSLRTRLHTVTLADAPDGELRYLMCSRSTPASALQRIDDALAPIPAQ